MAPRFHTGSQNKAVFVKDGQLAAFLQQMTTTHVRRWLRRRHSVGKGHLYPGTYKSFPVQYDDHFYTVCRYVERNALRANLVKRAEDWQFGSLWQRRQTKLEEDWPALAEWPLPRLRQWLRHVNRPETEAELKALRLSIHRGRPFGEERWQRATAERLGLQSILRPRGRRRKSPQAVAAQ